MAFGNCSLGDSKVSPASVGTVAILEADPSFGMLPGDVQHGYPVCAEFASRNLNNAKAVFVNASGNIPHAGAGRCWIFPA